MIQNPIPWPNGARCACSISFDIDADSLIHIAKPKDSFDRLYPITMGRYDQVAVPRVLETYRRLGLKQSFFIPAWTMNQYPDIVDAILAGGHEIGHHGYIHEDPSEISPQEQRHWFEKALGVHVRMTGRRPRGYRAPVYNATQSTIDLLIEHGFTYDSSLMADDIPYRMKTTGGTLFEVPPHWGSDDWPPFAHFAEIGYMMPVKSPTEGLAASFEEFDAQYEAGGFWMGIWHPFLTGRLARWRVVERWLEHTLSTKNVWFAPLEEIASYVDELEKAGRYQARTDDLPYYAKPVAL
ncbi:polysaccharide deacetylase [Rhizobium leguminosarum]|uniref:polysaccharide deacetylase family protein n=1 Tax=Rhizobium leguminosarum TaxID=384 RepID=UPI001C9554C0|nr:polysaccharide deacetylase [Rhizobium leguminosarum]MBY5592554.1 polysaccharide deacetylase [Rhizobium leguminosarum]MBY5603749.1 polysaccharide deacetylase [Rhizobium leguminosarum]